jgi:hypothetical protein
METPSPQLEYDAFASSIPVAPTTIAFAARAGLCGATINIFAYLQMPEGDQPEYSTRQKHYPQIP